MANSRQTNLLLLYFTIICAARLTQGHRKQVGVPFTHRVIHFPPLEREFPLQGFGEQWKNKNSRRMMIGSTAPTCTYNECRGCKYKCRAEQVPVEGNDPIHSAYHYRCVCRRDLKQHILNKMSGSDHLCASRCGRKRALCTAHKFTAERATTRN